MGLQVGGSQWVGLQVGGSQWVGLQVGGSQWVGLQVGGSQWWGYKWMRLQVGVTPLDKLSVVVPPVTANAAQTAA